MEPTGSNTVFHVSDIERSIVGNERGHSGFPESVGSHVVSGNSECPRFVGHAGDAGDRPITPQGLQSNSSMSCTGVIGLTRDVRDRRDLRDESNENA